MGGSTTAVQLPPVQLSEAFFRDFDDCFAHAGLSPAQQCSLLPSNTDIETVLLPEERAAAVQRHPGGWFICPYLIDERKHALLFVDIHFKSGALTDLVRIHSGPIRFFGGFGAHTDQMEDLALRVQAISQRFILTFPGACAISVFESQPDEAWIRLGEAEFRPPYAKLYSGLELHQERDWPGPRSPRRRSRQYRDSAGNLMALSRWECEEPHLKVWAEAPEETIDYRYHRGDFVDSRGRPIEASVFPDSGPWTPRVPLQLDGSRTAFLLRYELHGRPCLGLLRHCLLCGGTFPDSQADLLHGEPAEEEEVRFRRLAWTVGRIEELDDHLGMPDIILPPATFSKDLLSQFDPSSRRQFLYSSLSPQTVVIFREYEHTGIITVNYAGKWVEDIE